MISKKHRGVCGVYVYEKIEIKSAQLYSVPSGQNYSKQIPSKQTDKMSSDLDSQLWDLINRSHLEEVDIEELLMNGADPNSRNSYEETPLHITSMNQNSSLTEILVKYGADLNVEDCVGNTPLTNSLKLNRNPTYIQQLIILGADLNYINQDDITVLDRAFHYMNNEYGLNIISVLIKAGAKINKLPLELYNIMNELTKNIDN